MIEKKNSKNDSIKLLHIKLEQIQLRRFAKRETK